MRRINWRYAIGELLIVIIGITVAFALNNWAGNIKDRDLEKAYLQSIKTDLQSDIQQLDSNIAELNRRMGYLQKLRPHLYTKLSNRDTMALKMFAVTDPVGFHPQENTIQSMQFSGDLKLIKDLDLKNDIIAHYSVYDKVEIEIERHVYFAKDYLADYYMHQIDYTKFGTEDGYSFIEDPYFHNLVYALGGIYKTERDAQLSALESAKKMFEKL
ncbi:MAG: DUF6090 family protein [Owenweeksia sp.]